MVESFEKLLKRRVNRKIIGEPNAVGGGDDRTVFGGCVSEEGGKKLRKEGVELWEGSKFEEVKQMLDHLAVG